MNESLIAGRYAKALLEEALERGEAERLYPLMKHLGSTLRPLSSELVVVGNPTIADRVRESFVVGCVGCEPPALMERFVRLVFAHRRERFLGDMARAYVVLYRKARGIVLVRITSAVPLDEATRERVAEVVRGHYGREIEMVCEENKELLGGFVLRVDGKVLDASVRSRIDRIRQQFISKNRSIV